MTTSEKADAPKRAKGRDDGELLSMAGVSMAWVRRNADGVTFRSRRKSEGKWWGICEECEDEYYPITEHLIWHAMYEHLENLTHSIHFTTETLRNIIGRNTFTYTSKETTQEGKETFRLTVRQSASMLSQIIEPEPIQP